MTRLPDLERLLVDAAERLDATTPADSSAASGDHRHARTGMRARWHRMSRRGHVAGILAGTLVLGAVATGSAQVAGLDPFSYLSRFNEFDPQRSPSGKPGEAIVFSSPAGADRAWQARAYVAKNGDVCMTGGRAQSNPARASSSMTCVHSDELADQLHQPGRMPVVASFTILRGAQSKPRRLLVYALTPSDAGTLTAEVDREDPAAPAEVAATAATDLLRVPVDHRPDGLTDAGRERLAELPDTLELRLHAVEIAAPHGAAEQRGDVFLPEHVDQRAGEPLRQPVTTFTRWSAVPGNLDRTPPSHLLERTPEPVDEATPEVEQLVPVLAEARRDDDALPADFTRTRDQRRFRAQPQESRRLRPLGGSPLGDVWVVPAGAHADAGENPRFRGAYCLLGLPQIEGCEMVFEQTQLPRVEAVVCAPGLTAGQHLVWALVPRGATSATVRLADGTSSTQPVRDILLLPRPSDAPRVTEVVWSGPDLELRHPTRYPPQTASAKCAGPDGPEGSFIELRESTNASALHAWSR